MNTEETEIIPSDAWSPLVVGVVLAGGLSRRMGGGDKSLMILGGKPMISHAIERLSPQAGTLIINANRDSSDFSDFSRPVIADTVEGFAGPLAGILAGMEWARENAPDARWIASVAADTPFFPTYFVARCVAASNLEEDMIALAKSGEKLHPVFGLWPVSLADDLRKWLQNGTNRKVLAWVDRHQLAEISFPKFEQAGKLLDPFFNINSPDDLEVAQAILGEMAS